MTSEIAKLNKQFETATPQEILAWAVKTYGSGTALSSSFGGQSAALIHMTIQVKPDIPVLFLDTGFLFKETYAFADELKRKFNLNLKTFRASSAQISQTLKNLERRKKEGTPECCDLSKVDLMKQSLAGVTCWISGLRRSQGDSRKDIKIIEEDQSGLVKVHPLANWSSKQLYAYMQQNQLPFHPLWEKGYTSVGCEPCTSLPDGKGGERSGRWAGLSKEECGIHEFLKKPSKEN